MTISSERPKIRVTTIPITQNYLGAEGRLLKLGDRVYIYTRSSGWHSQLQIGVLDVSHPLTINWTPHEALSRPGNKECNWYNTCPKECISGVYTDAYPLSPDAANVATVTLYANTSRVNPTIMYSNTTNIINMLRIKDVQLEAAYTTTSCITHFGKGYCFTSSRSIRRAWIPYSRCSLRLASLNYARPSLKFNWLAGLSALLTLKSSPNIHNISQSLTSLTVLRKTQGEWEACHRSWMGRSPPKTLLTYSIQNATWTLP